MPSAIPPYRPSTASSVLRIWSRAVSQSPISPDMKTRHLLALFVLCASALPGGEAPSLDSNHRTVFFAVLEGLYRDGLSNEDVDLVLRFDPATGKLVVEVRNAHSDTVYGVCFNPDGKMLASCGADKFVKVHEIPSGKLVK